MCVRKDKCPFQAGTLSKQIGFSYSPFAHSLAEEPLGMAKTTRWKELESLIHRLEESHPR